MELKDIKRYEKKERWRHIDGVNEYYMISNFGRVINIKRKHFLKQCIDFSGYAKIGLYENKCYMNLLIHRLVAKSFIPNPENKPCVNHIDGNKLNNHINNLEWCTYSENTIHSYNTGLTKNYKGEKSHRSKITDFDRVKIIKEFNGGATQQEISFKYSLSQPAISYIIKNRAIYLPEKLNKIKIRSRGKAIIAFNTKDDIIGIYSSGIEASRCLGLNKWNISKVLKGIIKHTSGIKFKYLYGNEGYSKI